MCPFDDDDLNPHRRDIVALWHRERTLAAENERLRRELDKARTKPSPKSGKNKSERQRTGHRPPPAESKDETPSGHGPRAQPHLEEQEKVCDLDEADKVCTACGGSLEEWIGQEETSTLIDVVERRFVRQNVRQKKYRCRCGGCIETAPGPEKLIAGGRYSVNFAVEVAHDKYMLHSPLERQAREMTRQGLVIDSQTLWDQLYALGQLFLPVYHALHVHVLGGEWVCADETTWVMMGHKHSPPSLRKGEWAIWVAHCPDGAFYLFTPARDLASATALLTRPTLDAGGMPVLTHDGHSVGALYHGDVVCDGWWTYKVLAGNDSSFVLVHCWAHVRREILGCQVGYPEQTLEIMSLVASLYAIEKEAPMGPEGDVERAALRQTKSRAVLENIEAWVWKNALLVPPESTLRKAVGYMVGHWQGLCRFLDTPRLPLDNNATERDCRLPVLGKRNHYGSRSKRGADTAAILYSIVQSATLSGVEPKAYMRLCAARALRGQPVLLPHAVTTEHLSDDLALTPEEAERVLSRRPSMPVLPRGS